MQSTTSEVGAVGAPWSVAPLELAVLALLGSAVAGRTVLVSAGSATYTDGETIFLASGISSPTARRHVLTAQAALAAGDTFDLGVMRRLLGEPTVCAQRYLTLELARSAQQLSHVLPLDYDRLLSPHLDLLSWAPSSAEESCDLALSAAVIPAPPEWCGAIRPRAVLRRAGKVGGQRPSAAEEAAATFLVEDEDDSSDAPGQRSGLLEKLSAPFANPVGKALQRIAGAKPADGEGVAGAGVTRSRRSAGSPGSRARLVAPGAAGDSGATRGARGHLYPEWDSSKGGYRADWCTVHELEPVRRDQPLVPVGPPPRRLLRELAGTSPVWLPASRELSGDDLALDALVEHEVAVRSGAATDGRVFRGQRRHVGDLSVVVLLDATGSSAEEIDGRSAFDEHRLLAHHLCSALDLLGVRAASYGFRSRGRHDVRFLRIKTFEDRWGLAAQRRLQAVDAGGYTRLGAALRHGTHVASQYGGTARKVLLVVGDGHPYDDGYEGRSALEDSCRAAEEASALGVACAGISSRTPTTEPAWGAAAHLVSPRVDDLADNIRRFLTGALTTAHAGTRRSA